MAAKRKPFGVWLLLQDGEAWCYDTHRTLDEAMRTARALVFAARTNEAGPLYARPSRVWIAAPPVVALKPARARYRRSR
jgi:hypothetical protein